MKKTNYWKKTNYKKKIRRRQIGRIEVLPISVSNDKNWKKKKWEQWRDRRKKAARWTHKIRTRVWNLWKYYRWMIELEPSQLKWGHKKRKWRSLLLRILKNDMKEIYDRRPNDILTYWWINKRNKTTILFKKIRTLKKNKFLKKIKYLRSKKFINKKKYFLKRLILKKSKYLFKRYYKKKTNYKFHDKFKPLLLKNFEMSLAKFSLMTQKNWYSAFEPYKFLWQYEWEYNLNKSKAIKIYCDMLIKKNLFEQIRNIKILRSQIMFQYIHKQKVFGEFEEVKKKFPWWETLMFKQQLYKRRLSWKVQRFWFSKNFLPFSFKSYYRYKKPWREKKKRVYSNFSYLIYNSDHKNTVLNNKKQRIKQLLNKIILPLYGNIKPKQIRTLYKKKHFVKSKAIHAWDSFIKNLENRLDVVVYRLNLAPNIMWARRLINAGLVFLQRRDSKKNLLTNNYFRKKKVYPIQLNLLFNLYSLCLSNLKIKKFSFKTKPILEVDFKIEPGDIVQCHPFSIYQRWNIRPDLLNKPIPSYLLTKTKINIDNEWNARYQYIIRHRKFLFLYAKKKQWWRKNFNYRSYRYEWDESFLKETTSFFLFTPQKKDFSLNDRNSSLFLDWIIK